MSLSVDCRALQDAPAVSSEQSFRPGERGPVARVGRRKVVQKKCCRYDPRDIGRIEPFSTVDNQGADQRPGDAGPFPRRPGSQKKEDLLFTIRSRAPFQAALRQAEANLARDFRARRRARPLPTNSAYSFPAQARRRLAATNTIRRNASAASLAATVQADEAAVQDRETESRLYLDYARPSDGRHRQSAGACRQSRQARRRHRDGCDQPGFGRCTLNLRYPSNRLSEIRDYMADSTSSGSKPPFPERRGPGETGELCFVDNASRSEKPGPITLKGLFPNTDGKLWPGQFVNGHV